MRLERIIYAGEPFTADQQRILRRVSRACEIRSAGYASVEAASSATRTRAAGRASTACSTGPRSWKFSTRKPANPSRKPARPGRIVFTSLIRRLMPLLRYPTGDRAQWVEPAGTPDRKFLLLGRAEEAARLASYNCACGRDGGIARTVPRAAWASAIPTGRDAGRICATS